MMLLNLIRVTCRPFSSFSVWISLLRTWLLLWLSLRVDSLSELCPVVCSENVQLTRLSQLSASQQGQSECCRCVLGHMQPFWEISELMCICEDLPIAFSVSLGMLFPAISSCTMLLFFWNISNSDRPPSKPMLFHLRSANSKSGPSPSVFKYSTKCFTWQYSFLISQNIWCVLKWDL